MKKITPYLLIVALLMSSVSSFATTTFALEGELVAETTNSLCHDGLDNDENLVSDSSDPACASFFVVAPVLVAETTNELCHDGVDNDENIVMDSSDPSCASFFLVAPAPAVENTTELCHDGIDNDENILVDSSDPSCAAFFLVAPVPAVENTDELCHDGIDNDENILVDSSDPSCASFFLTPTTPDEEEEEESTPRRRSSGGSSRTTTTTSVPGTGTVLGAFTTSETNVCPYITGYAKIGRTNNMTDVVRIQAFLRENIQSDLYISGVFDFATLAAVNKLQTTYSNEILKPWVDAGLMEKAEATGYVYKTTSWFINSKVCPNSNVAFPILP